MEIQLTVENANQDIIVTQDNLFKFHVQQAIIALILG
jgi:hypothetical protein